MSGRRKKGKLGKGKRKHQSIRELRQAPAKTGSADPIGDLEVDWWQNAKTADKWKEKWECMQELMENACGDPWGKSNLPEKFDTNKKAPEVLALFAKWLMNENHIFVRQHMLKLLVPFSKSYEKSAWKKANSIAEGIMLRQWMEKKHGFLPLVTPALLAVYHVSGAPLKKWRECLVECMQSTQGQVRMSAWDFLAKVCMSPKKKLASKDIQAILSESKVIQLLTDAIINDKEKEVRDNCAKFIYGARKVCSKNSSLNRAYQQIMKDKRAANAMDAAVIAYDIDLKIINGGDAPNEEDMKLMTEKKHQKLKKRASKSRKSQMRAMIAAAKKQALKDGGGGKIEIGITKGTKRSSVNRTDSEQKESESEDDEDEDEDEEDSSSDDREQQRRERERELERKKKEKKRKAERERKRREKAERKEMLRKEKEKREKEEREREERERAKASASEDNSGSDDDENSDSSDEYFSNFKKHRKQNGRAAVTKPKKRKSKRIKESHTETIRDAVNNSGSAYVLDNARIDQLSSKVDMIQKSVSLIQNDMKGMERDISQLVRTSEANKNNNGSGSGSTKTEEKMMKILTQLQKDVKIMKNDISYIKACWEDAESVPSDN